MLLVKFKGLPSRDDASNSEGTSYHEFGKNIIEQLPAFISGMGAKVQLDWSRQNLSLGIEHLFWIRFRQSAKLSGFHLFCVLVGDLRFRFNTSVLFDF